MPASSGIPIVIANMVTQSIVAGEKIISLRSSWLLIYYCLLMFTERVIIPEDFRFNTLLAYLANAPVMLVSVLLGTFWDPFNQATTILLFLMALPAFLPDYPDRMMAVSGAWSALFLILSYHVKSPELFRKDLTYVIEFYLASMKFIPLLVENLLTHKVMLHVIKQVLADFGRRQESGMTLVPVSINLSRCDFEQCDIVQEITDLMDASGYPRSMIKINMQFMKNFAPGSKNVIIVSDIIDIAKRMGITTLIEGVETEEQYQFLQESGCEKLQGRLFNRPNTLDYIIDRAITHTGLTFENTGR